MWLSPFFFIGPAAKPLLRRHVHPTMQVWPLVVSLLLATSAFAGDGTVVHCFAFSKTAGASETDWEQFRTLTRALPQKISGLTRVTFGPLRRPMGQIEMMSNPGADDVKKFIAGQPIDAKVVNANREYGACFEFQSEAAFLAYGKHAAHVEWETAYKKVRVPGTTTFQIVAQ